MPDYYKDRDKAVLWARAALQKPFVVLDTETTGLGYDDEAVSIGVIDSSGKTLLDTLLCHTKPCSPDALRTHGHTWEATRQAPPFTAVYPGLARMLNGQHVLIYSAEHYDERILTQTCNRYNLSWQSIDCYPAEVLPPFAEFYGEWNDYHGNYRWQRLTTAAAHFGIDTTGAHGAIADCLMTLGVVKGMAAAKLSTE